MEVGIADLRKDVSDIVNRVIYQGERAVLQRRGKNVAAIVSLEDLARLEALEDEADLRAAKKARKEKGAVALKDVKARLGMK